MAFPDGLLGAGWPSMYPELNVPVSYAGVISMIISLGTIVSSLMSDRLTRKLGTGRLTAISVAATAAALVGLALVGLGCAPVYPCIIHSTPFYFGAENSQAIIGVQMASAYVGICLAPPLFSLMANHISASPFPLFILCFLALMTLMHERLIIRAGISNETRKPFWKRAFAAILTAKRRSGTD